MPFSSGEMISQMNNMQHQGMLMSALSNMNGGADTLAGGVLSRGAAIGRPLMSMGMGLLGLDPLSLGLRAGTAAFGSGAGVLGAGLAGMGVMAGVGAIGVAGGYAGNQMMHGAQQQLALNRSLSRNFNFMNSQGGMGFTSQQGYQIGEQLHSMTGVMGPSGEVATFGELSRLASNMGRMGLAQNVRTVTEFKEKFKQMIDTLKTVATDLGTSLEEAQKMMASMKSSGIFRPTDLTRMTKEMRAGAMASGLAMSEFSGAASIGSQISRSVGGLGRQGANAGVRTMEMIGMAQKVGAISEEDVYNATGLTGAEGRQALATSQMQHTASFLRTGRGRYFLASMADRNGNLNEQAVMEWMSGGGMSTGRTKELANQNLAGVGRANFIRNEGRLRGAVMERFGGLAQSMAYKEWLQSKGFDPNDMNDRAMLAFQRFSGMGRDEADVAIKEIQAMPEMLRQMQNTKQDMRVSDQKSKYLKTHGLQGMKRKFDAIKEDINGSLEHLGSSLLRSVSDNIESWYNKTMGIYVSVATEGIEEVSRNFDLGGPGARRDYKRYFGSAAKGGAAGFLSSKTVSANLKQAMENQNLRIGTLMSTGDKDVLNFASQNSEMIKITTAGASTATPQETLAKFRAELAEKARDDKLAQTVLQKFDKASPVQQAAYVQAMQEKVGANKDATLMGQLDYQRSKFEYQGSGFLGTVAEFERTLGKDIAGADAETARKTRENIRGEAGARGDAQMANFMMAKEGIVNAGGIGGPTVTLEGQDEQYIQDKYQAMGKMIRTKEGMALMADMFGGDKDVSAQARDTAFNKITAIRTETSRRENKRVTAEEAGQIDLLASSALASKYSDALKQYGHMGKAENMVDKDKITKEYRELTGDTTITAEEVFAKIQSAKTRGGDAAVQQQHIANLQEDLQRMTSAQGEETERLTRSGFMARDEKTGQMVFSASSKEAMKGLSKEGVRAAELAQGLVNYDLSKPSDTALKKTLQSAGMTREQFDKLDANNVQRGLILQAAAHEEYSNKRIESSEAIQSLSVAEKQKLAKAGSQQAGYFAAVEQNFLSLTKASGGSEMGAMAKMMGLDLSKEQLEMVKGGKTSKEQIERVFSAAGLDGKTFESLKADLEDALGKKTTGGRSGGIASALGHMTDDQKKALQEKKAEKDDPSFRELQGTRRAIEKQEGILRIIASASQGQIDALKALDAKNGGPEGGGQPPAGK